MQESGLCQAILCMSDQLISSGTETLSMHALNGTSLQESVTDPLFVHKAFLNALKHLTFPDDDIGITSDLKDTVI